MRLKRSKRRLLEMKELCKREIHMKVLPIEDVGESAELYIFPRKWTRKMQKQWLQEAYLPHETEHHKVYCEYDCSGECHAVYVTFKKNTVTLDYRFDV